MKKARRIKGIKFLLIGIFVAAICIFASMYVVEKSNTMAAGTGTYKEATESLVRKYEYGGGTYYYTADVTNKIITITKFEPDSYDDDKRIPEMTLWNGRGLLGGDYYRLKYSAGVFSNLSIGNLIIPESIEIGDISEKYILEIANAFNGATIEKVSMYDTIIPEGMFSGATINSISSSNNKLQYIEKNAFKDGQITVLGEFYNCSKIGEGAFENCKIKKITLTKCTIGTGAFKGSQNENQNLTEIILDSCSISDRAFNEVKINRIIINKNATWNVRAFYKTTITSLEWSNLKIDTIIAKAFCGCTFKNKVTVPNSVVQIEAMAFINCTFENGLTLPTTQELRMCGTSEDDGVWGGFSGATINGDFTIPENVTEINSYALSRMNVTGNLKIQTSTTKIEPYVLERSKLNKIEIGSEVKKLPSYIFSGCTINGGILNIPKTVTEMDDYACSGISIGDKNNGTIYLDANIQTLKSYTFAGSQFKNIIFTSKLTEIENNAFDGCTGMSEIQLPDTLKTIGEAAFQNCTTLKTVIIPKEIYIIEQYTFNGCKALTQVKTPNNEPLKITYIGRSAFMGCGFTDIKELLAGFKFIDENTEAETYSGYIGYEAFRDNTQLTDDIVVQPGITYGERAFIGCTKINKVTIEAGAIMPSLLFWDCTGIGEVVIKDGVEEIANGAFYRCTGISKIDIPPSVKRIGSHSFNGCTSLKTINFNWVEDENEVVFDGVTEIAAHAFRNCSALKDVEIPYTVSKIGDKAFYNCPSMGTITLTAGTTELGELCIVGLEEEWNEETRKYEFKGNKEVIVKTYAPAVIEAYLAAEVNKDRRSVTYETILDTTEPEIEVSIDPIDFTKDKVTLTVKAIDKETGIPNEKGYCFNGKWQDSNEIEITENGPVTIQVKDCAEDIEDSQGNKVTDSEGNKGQTNKAKTEYTVKNIDKTGPTIKGIYYYNAKDNTELKAGDWTNQNVIVYIDAKDLNYQGEERNRSKRL